MSQIVLIQIIVTVAILSIAFAEALFLQHRKPGSFDCSEAWLSVADMAGRRLLALLPIGIATPVFSWVWTQRLFTIELSGFATFVLLFLGLEFFYYWYHRASHRIGCTMHPILIILMPTTEVCSSFLTAYLELIVPSGLKSPASMAW